MSSESIIKLHGLKDLTQRTITPVSDSRQSVIMASEPCDCKPCRTDAAKALEYGDDLKRPPTLLEVADMLINQHYDPQYHDHVLDDKLPFTMEHRTTYQLLRDLTADEKTGEALLWRHALQIMSGYYENLPDVRTEKPDKMDVCNNQMEKQMKLVTLDGEEQTGFCSAYKWEDQRLVAATTQDGGENEIEIEAASEGQEDSRHDNQGGMGEEAAGARGQRTMLAQIRSRAKLVGRKVVRSIRNSA